MAACFLRRSENVRLMQNIIGYKNDRYLKHVLMLLGFLCHFLNSFLIFLKTKLIAIFLSFVIFFGSFSHLASADDGLDTIVDILTNLTCETQGVGNLFRSEFTHTCIPAPFFTVALATVISGGLYPGVMIRTYINDDELFPGECERGKRIDFSDQKLSFSFCNNTKLAAKSVGAVAKSAVVIAKSLFVETDVWGCSNDDFIRLCTSSIYAATQHERRVG